MARRGSAKNNRASRLGAKAWRVMARASAQHRKPSRVAWRQQ
jgi:hypothetical protein